MKKLQFNAHVILGFFFVSLLSLVLGFLTSGASTTAAFSVYRASLPDPLTYVRFYRLTDINPTPYQTDTRGIRNPCGTRLLFHPG